MDTHTISPITAAVSELPGHSDRRHGSHTSTFFSLFYSYMDSGQTLIGAGTVTDLSSSGIGIRAVVRHLLSVAERSRAFVVRVRHGQRVVQEKRMVGCTRHERNPPHRPSRNGKTILHYPKPGLLGRRMSIWGGDKDLDVGREESSAILLMSSRHSLSPQRSI